MKKRSNDQIMNMKNNLKDLMEEIIAKQLLEKEMTSEKKYCSRSLVMK